MSTSFQELRRAKGLTSREVADAAGVSLAEEYLYEIGGIVDKEVGQRIVKAFEQLTGERFNVSDQPTTILNTVGGTHVISNEVSRRQGRTNRKDRTYPDYD